MGPVLAGFQPLACGQPGSVGVAVCWDGRCMVSHTAGFPWRGSAASRPTVPQLLSWEPWSLNSMREGKERSSPARQAPGQGHTPAPTPPPKGSRSSSLPCSPSKNTSSNNWSCESTRPCVLKSLVPFVVLHIYLVLTMTKNGDIRSFFSCPPVVYLVSFRPASEERTPSQNILIHTVL